MLLSCRPCLESAPRPLHGITARSRCVLSADSCVAMARQREAQCDRKLDLVSKNDLESESFVGKLCGLHISELIGFVNRYDTWKGQLGESR